MASCSDLTRISSATDVRFVTKATLVPITPSKKLLEPFHRLKNRGNLFRRKNSSSQLDLGSCPRIEQIIPSSPTPLSSTLSQNNVTLLKRSNSMICPQDHLRTFLQPHDQRRERNSICFEPKNDSQRKLRAKMSHIAEDEVLNFEPSTPVPFREQGEVIRSRRTTALLSPRQSYCSSIDEPFFDCHEISSSSKISACTMTGQSLTNLSSSSSSEEKGVQTTRALPSLSTTLSSSSLSSSSIQTDSLENKSPSLGDQRYKWPHLYERLLGEQPCIYWVNYLGSTAIKMSEDDPASTPTHAMTRLKESTQYARVLPIIGLSISSRGVEFLKHVKDRTVICFHPIKSIHCACQDRDLRYFAYVTREQRLLHGTSHSAGPRDDHHHYCHIFVVKDEPMSTEILLTFGQVFDLAYRLHQRVNGKNLQVDQLSLKTMSSSSDERKVFI